MIVTVSSSAALASALKTVHDGDTIQLTAGEYTLSKLQSMSFASGVTITSADPAHQAVLDGVNMQNVSGLTLSNLEVKVDDKLGAAIILSGGNNDHFTNLNIHGTGVGDGVGVRVVGTNLTLANSNIHDVGSGINISNSDAIAVTGNQIHNVQIDGIGVVGTSDIAISGNSFTNFYPVAGNHSDAIQFLTAGTTKAAHDITITNNTYVRGAGEASTQGIFLGNEAKINYENVNISGNTIIGAIYNGIAVTDVDHLSLTHNTVQGYTDITSEIFVTGATNSSLASNSANNFITTANPSLTITGDTVIKQAAIGDTSALTSAPTAAATSAPVSTVAVVAPTTPAPTAAHQELVAVQLTSGTASITAPSGSAGFILDPNPHVWQSNEIGSAGNDTITASKGGGGLVGGAGDDHFVFTSVPGGTIAIGDFTHGQDVIDMRGLFASIGYAGTNPIADHHLTLLSDGAGGTKVMLDPDGTGPKAALYILDIQHVAPTTLTTTDWIFH